jgi:glycosyltransferase involved in cell wall biosynthesis
MRILIDLQGAQSGSRWRGIGRYASALAKAIIRNRGDHDIFLLLNGLLDDTAAQIIEEFSAFLPADRILVFFAPSPVEGINSESAWRREAAELIREWTINALAPDALLITSLFEGVTDNSITSIGRFEPLIKTAVILHDLIPYLYHEEYLTTPEEKQWYYSKIDSLLKANLLLTVSNYARIEAVDILCFDADRVITISSAVDERFKSAAILSEEGEALLARLGIRHKFVLHVSAFEPRKNFEGLIRAYALLPAPIRQSHQLVLVTGSSPDGQNLLRRIAEESGLRPDELVLLGYIPDSDLIALYSLCTLFVFPSFHEGFGLPALEAMGCGAAVIGSNVTSIPEVIGREDALFDPYSVQSIAGLMRRVLTDGEFYNSLKAYAPAQAKRFSWDESAKRALRAIEKMGGSRPPRPGNIDVSVLLDKIAALKPGVAPTRRDLIAVSQSISINERMVYEINPKLNDHVYHKKHTPSCIFICVRGLHDYSDSIGFDAVYEYVLLSQYYKNKISVRIFSERFDNDLYPDIPIENISKFFEALRDSPNALVIYHFCDGWLSFEKAIRSYKNLVVRWHNNTPPWFFAKYALHPVEATIRGFRSIIRLARQTDCRFWCNSNFTARQLELLGVDAHRIGVVYPASRYLEKNYPSRKIIMKNENNIKILFVSRITSHKGHKYIILVSYYLQELGIISEVICPGREYVPKICDELITLANTLGVNLIIPGEVDNTELQILYEQADIFTCFSEHEGFGLPVFEAMRMDIPVVAWTNTATAELLRGHPLSSDELDPKWFAAAIAASRDSKVHSYVVRWQRENILPKYTKEVILQQLIGNVMSTSRCYGYSLYNEPNYDHDDEIMHDLQKKISEYYGYIKDIEIEKNLHISKEIPENFVTLYDIESFESLLPTEVKFLGPWQSVFIPAHRFSSMCSELSGSGYLCSLTANKEHFIFGPYIKLPQGNYKAFFRFEIVRSLYRSGSIRFDVAYRGAPICELLISLKNLHNKSTACLEFCHKQADDEIEFRMGSQSCRGGIIKFYGVELLRVGDPCEGNSLDGRA